MTRLAIAFSTLAAGVACHAPVPAARTAGDGCAAPTRQVSPGANAAALAGEYRVRFIATRGPAAGAHTDARLRLVPRADSLQRAAPILGVRDTTTRYPLAGSIDLEPATLGAVATGNPDSADPLAPGVLVIERHPTDPVASTSIILRVGADANRRGPARFDGGYFALTVREMQPDRFAGTWSSGTAGEAAAGHFCAERAGP